MLDRASTFADPDIIAMLQEKFVPVAIDQAYHRRQQDAEGEFYRQLCTQGPRKNVNSTTQGLYIGTADGQLLVFNNNRGPERIKRLMRQALRDYDPKEVDVPDAGQPDPRHYRVPPEGGLVVRVNAKVLGGYAEAENRWRAIFQSALSRDNLWATRREHGALARGEVLRSFAERLARFHLVDNTRGEPPMWRREEIKHLELTIEDGTLRGRVHLETADGRRGYEADLLGHVETREGRVTRFDLVAHGEFWGEGRYTRGAPKGRFPLGVAFRLADGSDEADKVPPQGSRGWLRGYIDER